MNWLDDETEEPMTLRDIEREVALAWEAKTGADSIDTIERIYGQTRSGAYECIYPDCSFVHRDSHVVWKHVHGYHQPLSLPPDDFDPGPWL